ncbi:tetratricopeptide repeat protein 1 [Bicyclus anynana]|uniref:Tetratricopeptide repeat protein 1 n=1 Tax=Bicyclus anynana TaxID=110368 RepID=A0A6J1NZS5_BICAN|nr:tetratricopeptide repeat protein 1 [Bicyclus anynana]
MSDRLKSTHNVSNEEVIDDLTKDLEFTLRSGDKGNSVINSEDSAKDSKSSPADTKENHPDDIPLSDDEPDGNSKDDSDTESVDEVTLKDLEMELTDDQKEERRIIAEELKTAGNLAFKDADYDKCIEKYTEALSICPLQFPQQRAILYCNRGAARMKLEKYKRAAHDCTKAIELDDKYLKAYYRRAQSYEATDKLDESLADYKKMLELDPTHKEASNAVIRLPPLIEERNEKLKTEMLGKLKDLGNMILKPFGLSTENFQLQQDGESKGYTINFKQ